MLADAGVACPILNIGLPDRFVEHGSRDDCLADAGLDAHGIRRQISTRLHEAGIKLNTDPGIAHGGL